MRTIRGGLSGNLWISRAAFQAWHIRDPAGGGRGTSRVSAGVWHKFADKRHDRDEKGLGKLRRGNFSAFALRAALAQLSLAHRL